MDARELIRAGRLADARKQLVAEVRSAPGDAGKRTLLFQTLAYLGEWDKAQVHVDAIAAQDIKVESGAQQYRNLLQAEKERSEADRNLRRPSCVPASPPWLESWFEVRGKLLAGDAEGAAKASDRADTGRPPLSGSVNGKRFEGFRDTDALLAPFMEAFVHDRYVWIPFVDVAELSVPAPKTLLDLLWISARVSTWEGMELNCVLPVLYPGSSGRDDDRIKLGRMTEWIPLCGSYARGAGQHVYEAGGEEIPLLEIRELVFDNARTGGEDEKLD